MIKLTRLAAGTDVFINLELLLYAESFSRSIRLLPENPNISGTQLTMISGHTIEVRESIDEVLGKVKFRSFTVDPDPDPDPASAPQAVFRNGSAPV